MVLKLVKEINLTKPDIVLFTGDLVDKNTEYNKEIDNILIENLKNINAYYGKYYVNGDEDLLYKTFDTIIASDSKIININTATVDELSTLSGIGKAIAERIVAYRMQNGKFENIEDIKNVTGIGDSKFNNIKDEITAK